MRSVHDPPCIHHSSTQIIQPLPAQHKSRPRTSPAPREEKGSLAHHCPLGSPAAHKNPSLEWRVGHQSLAEKQVAAESCWEVGSRFSLRAWPLVSQSCSNGKPHPQEYMDLMGFIYKRKKKMRTHLKDAEGSGAWKGCGVGGWAEGNVI